MGKSGRLAGRCGDVLTQRNRPYKLGAVDEFIYFGEIGGKIVGMTDVRRYFNAFLEKYAGYTGDSVCPAERRKGYAAAMLRETFRAVKKSD